MRVNWVSTFDPLLVDDRFQTSAIPVAGSLKGSKPGRVNVIASPAASTSTSGHPPASGYMRAFIEGDFAGANNTLRLRHAYGQWRRFIFGQTWSTFSDPEAEPDGIDFEGLNAIVLFRQPQIRWSFPLADRFRMAFALEDPRPDLTGATGINQVPMSSPGCDSNRGAAATCSCQVWFANFAVSPTVFQKKRWLPAATASISAAGCL